MLPPASLFVTFQAHVSKAVFVTHRHILCLHQPLRHRGTSTVVGESSAAAEVKQAADKDGAGLWTHLSVLLMAPSSLACWHSTTSDIVLAACEYWTQEGFLITLFITDTTQTSHHLHWAR